jgi:glycosyltransferase involved in cell wall biosynthesis
MSPVRVAFVSSYTGLGGGETSLLALMAALDRERVEPVVVCPREGQLPAAARTLDIEVRIMPWRPSNILFVPWMSARSRSAAGIREALRAIAPDVVYSDFHTLPYVAVAGHALGRPVIFGCYGWWFRPRRWQRAFYRRGPWRIHAISDAVRDGFLGEPPFMDPSRVKVIRLGVDASAFAPRPGDRQAIRRSLGLSENGALVTLLARFQRVKGHDVFVTAATKILDCVPDAELAIAGDNVFAVAGDERYKQQVTRRVAADPRLRSKLRLLGWIESSSALLAASDVVVCSSRFESFGVVHLEAMACGVPVVSTNRGGPAETVVDGETGFLVPPERPDAIADRVVRLLRDPELSQRMGTAGRQRVVESFTIERYAADMMALFEAAAAATR